LVRGPLVEATADSVLVRVPNVARFLVRAGSPVRLERERGLSDKEIECFLHGPVAAARAVLDGQLPLRGAAVSVREAAVLILGHAAAGKSTLAAALAMRGHALLADSLAIISGDGDVGPAVSPAQSRVILWPDMVRELGLDPAAGEIVRPSIPSRAFALGPEPETARVGAFVVLTAERPRRDPELSRLEGHEKFQPLLGLRWHLQVVEGLGLGSEQLEPMARLAGAAPFFRLRRPSRGSARELAELVEGLVP
jgi:hypothetical protein